MHLIIAYQGLNTKGSQQNQWQVFDWYICQNTVCSSVQFVWPLLVWLSKMYLYNGSLLQHPVRQQICLLWQQTRLFIEYDIILPLIGFSSAFANINFSWKDSDFGLYRIATKDQPEDHWTGVQRSTNVSTARTSLTAAFSHTTLGLGPPYWGSHDFDPFICLDLLRTIHWFRISYHFTKPWSELLNTSFNHYSFQRAM